MPSAWTVTREVGRRASRVDEVRPVIQLISSRALRARSSPRICSQAVTRSPPGRRPRPSGSGSGLSQDSRFARVVCLLPPHFYCRGSARICRTLRENENYRSLPTPTAYHLGSLDLMGLKENLVGVGSLRPVGGRGSSKRLRRFSRQCQVHGQ